MTANAWQQMLNKHPSAPESSEGPADGDREAEDFAAPPDPTQYRPWILQRGARPAMFIDFRRFEPRARTLLGCMMSYPQLISVEYTGDRIVTLDFGIRQFAIEGTGLQELPSRLQRGMVLAIQEYSPSIWAARDLQMPVVSRLTIVGRNAAGTP